MTASLSASPQSQVPQNETEAMTSIPKSASASAPDRVEERPPTWRETEAEGVIEALQADRDRLAEALKPFAKAGELFDPPPEGYDICIYGPAAGPEYQIVGADLYRARAALQAREG